MERLEHPLTVPPDPDIPPELSRAGLRGIGTAPGPAKSAASPPAHDPEDRGEQANRGAGMSAASAAIAGTALFNLIAN